ncbi:phospholipase A and acyltransferase 3-like [Phyllostomus hastatus]|uniref:phospholipase A and acyltransferase 3-like n=1 Tax=Phyllostomus hastatus TaxID=9423 RepID=UPI001E681D6D|nr:phospholipase A and acyltransferase 3-like [Phyllostomus hastatus]
MSLRLKPGKISSTSVASLLCMPADKAIVKKELLSVVAGTDKFTVKNKHDDEYPPLPPSKIVQRAEHLVGQEMSYDIWTWNCEHFANQLRYGVSRSDQVTDALVALCVTAGILGVGLGLIWFLLNRCKREKQEQ